MSQSETLVLQSLANPTVRRLVRLRDNRTRRREKRLLVDGWRESQQAIQAGLDLIGLYTPETLDTRETSIPSDHQTDVDDTASVVLATAQTSGKLRRVSNAVMKKIAYGDSDRGVVGEFAEPQRRFEDLRLPKAPMLLVLDCIEKPGNIGAVFRCADAAGVDAVILCGSGSDIYNPNAIRSSLGTVFRIPSVAAATESEVAKFLISQEIKPFAARVESSSEIWSTDFSGSIAILIGSEANGLGDRWQSFGGEPVAGVRIPMWGRVDSLNASVSAAILLYEARRQRNS
ncbi:23S rRNA (guanosine-2'-O-)-methyltransferase RlmB [Planctomycetes bacterium CA13]|uniref:23S rRNA (Guanosine-2'-O-)-methyltransferase RlmB n=1 Tax=Novipirellula herctigrandis TaxID=2527986 RepID=A0A5C5YN98_9BACT|nr:23S rRNA (guanosine-2'-O-)-methyltransferase RlmB [Planctomycetes bacterium CA13]